MKLFTLLFKGKIVILIILVCLGLFSGGAHVFLLSLMNNTLSNMIKGIAVSDRFIINIIVVLVVYLLINRILSGYLIKFSRKSLHDIRMQVMRNALNADYWFMKEKQEYLYSTISKDTTVLSQSALGLIHIIGSLVTIVGCLIYLAYLSISIFVLVLSVTIVGVGFYMFSNKKPIANLEKARESEDEMFFHIQQVINGFKEIKINPDKGSELVEGPLCEASANYCNTSTKGFVSFYNNMLISQFVFYLALVSLIFAGGTWLGIATPVLINCFIVAIYLMGPLGEFTAIVPQLGEANIAANRIDDLVNSFSGIAAKPIKVCEAPDFNQITFDSISYSYPLKEKSDQESFCIGPIDFELRKGEVTFIYGGNGAGKTTFIHLFLGLLEKEKGGILLNDKPINSQANLQSLVSVVFSDFHLFDRLLGVKSINEKKVNEYLCLFELDKKVTFENNQFSSIKLSTGQRKRLALISVLLENRPVIVLDEWAADQDPAFRKKFYTEILPILKAEGFTILAITHDDKYYETADSLYKMEYGKLINENKF